MRYVLLWALAAGCVMEPYSPAQLVLTQRPPPPRFGFPLAEPDLFYQTVGVDHDPEVQEPGIMQGFCTDYVGRAFPWCYDEHSGSDYLMEGGFETMDAGSVEILAAMDGVVVATDDGHYDRCQVAPGLGGIDCDGNDGLPNFVILEHYNGMRTLYWHMKTDSVAVEVGDEVLCGEVLGLVGSSGNSSMPHLHFEVNDADGHTLDAYAGPYSQEESYWEDQGPSEGLPEPGCTAR